MKEIFTRIHSDLIFIKFEIFESIYLWYTSQLGPGQPVKKIIAGPINVQLQHSKWDAQQLLFNTFALQIAGYIFVHQTQGMGAVG